MELIEFLANQFCMGLIEDLIRPQEQAKHRVRGMEDVQRVLHKQMQKFPAVKLRVQLWPRSLQHDLTRRREW